MKMTKFKTGDVVYLKSDLNQKMTVKQIDDDGITCIWFGSDKGLLAHHFLPEILMLDTELQKLKAKCIKIDKHCKEVEESDRELREKVRNLENHNRDLIKDKKHWSDLYDKVESRYREYRDWLIELKMIKNSPETHYSKTREEWKKIREQENGKDK
jgi:uncharacterized protein YodC (DUF2158 family)